MKTAYLFIILIIGVFASNAIAQERWMPLGLPPHVETEARSAGVSHTKIHSYLKKNFHKLIDSTGNIFLESEEFGIDYLIVAKLVFGLQRKVEKNPWPTGQADQFLVKDELTIGYRFGAGLVVFGDIGYVKKYTLVQPVASHREGMLMNDFIINLLLPIHIQEQRLPEKYVLMTEGYLEGRGRLKLGGGIMLNPFVHQTHRSKVELSRTYIDNTSPESMKVFIDQSAFKEWGQLLYVTNGWLSYTLFKADFKYGQTHRNFYEIQKNLPEFNEVLYRLTVHNDYDILKDFGLERSATDTFRQTSSDIGLFGLYSAHSRNRYDEIEEFMEDANGELVLINQQYQHENERESSWFNFLSGEEFFSNILFMAYNDDNQLVRPHVVISTRITDKKANIKEMERKYLDSINKIALNSNTVALSAETLALVKENKPRAAIDMRLTFNDKAINKIISLSEKDFWNHIYKVTNADKDRWDEALEFNSSSSVQRRDPLRSLAVKLRSIGRNLRDIKKCEDNRCRIKTLSSILRRCVYISNGTYASELLAIMHSLVKGDLSIEGSVGLINDDRIVDVVTWDNGVKVEVPQKYYRFNFKRATEIYHMFSKGY
tara:strand:+ start:20654 stop:22453 length:1800 start_codon:yes stop_codon:yes gene_type:complete